MLAARRHNLPAPHRSLIGREQDSATVRELTLEATGRLVTLTGTGGCGKTQLALLVAASLTETFPDGVWLVDLAPVQAPDLVPYAVATVLGRRERTGEALLDTVVTYLTARELLLVLDNCEHLIEACASLAERVLNGCPRVRLLATSREQLRIGGEATWRVPSLASPDPRAALSAADLLAYPAVRLFVDRAQAVKPSFSFGSANASPVAGICARLEGLPLALELAAACVPALSLPQILERLDNSFRLLVGGSRTAPTRQQTLRATLDWSYGLLNDQERALFGRLAVFTADCSLDAAEAVCAAGDVGPADVLYLLHLLVDKSLVLADEQSGRSRYRLLEPVRQYAHDRLVKGGELEEVRRRHALYFLAFAERLERATNVGGPERPAATAALGQEYPNIRLALGWSQECGWWRCLTAAIRCRWTIQPASWRRSKRSSNRMMKNAAFALRTVGASADVGRSRSQHTVDRSRLTRCRRRISVSIIDPGRAECARERCVQNNRGRTEAYMGVMPGAGAFFFEGSDVGCLLIHGFTGTPQNIRPLGDFLARRGLTVLAPRLAGHGTSVEDFEQSGPEDWIATINTGLDQLRRTCSSVSAIGISMGGTLALHLGATRGSDLACVGCINGPVMDMPDFDAAASDPSTPARLPAPWTNPRILTKDLNSAGITYSEIPKVTLKKALGLFKQVQGELGQVRTPTLLFYSRDDAIVDAANGAFILERLATNDKRLIELIDSAHEATLDFDLERIGLEWLAFVRQHSRVLAPA